MQVELHFANKTEGYSFGDAIEEIEAETAGEVYRRCLGLFGRCVSKVYIGEDEPRVIGWVFEQAQRYEDTGEKFIRETWVVPLEKIVPEQHVPRGV